MASAHVLESSNGPPTGFQKFLKRIECPVDQDADYENTTWVNRDLIPMPADRRTYRPWSYIVYWMISGCCISSYTTGSSLLAYGLNAGQSMGCIAAGAICSGLLAVGMGWMGSRHHIGFTLLARISWGFYGGFFPIIISIFTTIFWDGLQAYWGGQAMAVCFGAMSTSYHEWDTMLAGGTLRARDLIGTLVYYVFFLTIMYIPPEHLQKPFIVSSVLFAGTIIGMLAWGVSQAGGAGPLFDVEASAPSVPWGVLFGIMSILGAWGGGTLGQSDWTRYARTKFAPTYSQLIAAPLTIFITATIGIIITSCAEQIIGETIWEPFVLLPAIQDYYGNSSRARAGVFFAGLGCVTAQLSICIVLNSVSCGMNIAGLYPKYLNIRRGAYILAAVGICTQPWEILANAGIFLSVLGGFGTLLAPFSGIILADYFVVRRRRLVMEDLFRGDETSIYWYNHGVNWRAFAAFLPTFAILLPGWIMSLQGSETNAWTRMFNLTWILGISISMSIYSLASHFYPPAGIDRGVRVHTDDMDVFGAREKRRQAGVLEAADVKTKEGDADV